MNAFFHLSVLCAAAGLSAGLFLDEERHRGVMKLFQFILSLALLAGVCLPVFRFLSGDIPWPKNELPEVPSLSADSIWNEAEMAAIEQMQTDVTRAFPSASVQLRPEGENGIRSIRVTGDENAPIIARYLEGKYGIPCEGG